MYQYHSAVVKHRSPNVHYEELDVRNVRIRELMRDYADIYLVLTNPHLTGPQTLLLSEVPASLITLDPVATVLDWLTSVGSTTLPTHSGTPAINTQAALARDVWQAGYTADLCVPSGSPLNDAPDQDKTDVWLTRPETDYVDVQRHCLATVNGFVHRLDADIQGAYIKDAGTTFHRSGEAHLGLISFKNIGRVHTHSITPEMIYQPAQTVPYSDRLYINLPFDATGRVVGIVIGGYLHLATNDIMVTGPHTLRVDMNRIPYLERYMVSRKQMDQSAMEQFHVFDPTHPDVYDLQGFHSNIAILELLSLSQSFLVSIDVDHLSAEVINLARTGLPGRFYHDEQPLYPLRTELGRLPSYLSEEEKGVWVVRIDNNLRQHRFMDTYDYRWNQKIDEKRVTGQRETFAQGQLIRWATHRLTLT